MAKRKFNDWAVCEVSGRQMKTAFDAWRKAQDNANALQDELHSMKNTALIAQGKLTEGHSAIYTHRFGEWKCALEDDGSIASEPVRVRGGKAKRTV